MNCGIRSRDCHTSVHEDIGDYMCLLPPLCCKRKSWKSSNWKYHAMTRSPNGVERLKTISFSQLWYHRLKKKKHAHKKQREKKITEERPTNQTTDRDKVTETDSQTNSADEKGIPFLTSDMLSHDHLYLQNSSKRRQLSGFHPRSLSRLCMLVHVTTNTKYIMWGG